MPPVIYRKAQYFKQCRGKERHPSEGKALAHVRALTKRDGAQRYQAYFCAYCQSWHVGSVELK